MPECACANDECFCKDTTSNFNVDCDHCMAGSHVDWEGEEFLDPEE